MDWERARKPEQKAVRRNEILAAARRLFSDLEYEEISLNAIAREADLSKPCVYRYFSTREEIFLAIFEATQTEFVDDLIGRLGRTRAQDLTSAIARIWVDTALDHPDWLELLPQLSSSLEKNSSVVQLVRFKQIAYQRFDDLVDALCEADTTLDRARWTRVAQWAFSMMAGLWPHANPGENVVRAHEHPEVDRPLWDFAKLMKPGLAAMIRGSRASNPDVVSEP